LNINMTSLYQSDNDSALMLCNIAIYLFSGPASLKSLYVVSALMTFAEPTENECINAGNAKGHLPLIYITAKTDNPCSSVSLQELSYLLTYIQARSAV